MPHARIAIAAVVMMAATAETSAKGEYFSGSIGGQFSVETRYHGSLYMYPDNIYQDRSDIGAGSLTYSFGFALPNDPMYGSILESLSFSINGVSTSPTPGAIIGANDSNSGLGSDSVAGFGMYEFKGFSESYSFFLEDHTGTYFETGFPVPGMGAWASISMSEDVGFYEGTVIRTTTATFSGRVPLAPAPVPVPVPEPSGLVLMGISGLCGLIVTAGARHLPHRRNGQRP